VDTAAETQDALYTLLVRDARAVEAHAERLAASLPPDALSWSPPDDGWSIAQVFEHMCIVHESYLQRIDEFLDGDELPRRGAGDVPWTPRFAGAFLVRSLTSPRKLAAPRKYRVGARVRGHVIQEFIALNQRLRDHLARAAPLEWRACRLASPLAPTIRQNLGDAFLVAVVHAQRHLGQVERTRDAMARQSTSAADR